MRERHARKRLLTMAALAAVLIAAGATAVAYGLTGHDGSYSRPSGIPASIPDSQVNLMELSPVPVRPAPGFTLTDQDGRVLPLSAFRGKVVVLEFMDPHCTDICPIVSAEFTDAYRDLGRQAGQVVFAAVNVNQYHHAVADVAAYSRAHAPADLNPAAAAGAECGRRPGPPGSHPPMTRPVWSVSMPPPG